MILVEIFVPAVNRKQDFKLDENAYIADIISEVGTMIFGGEDTANVIENLILCDDTQHRVLALDQTLGENNIRSGERLLLI